ncbi:thermonuclease family protein [Roseibacterium sp. SDUM158016]|jgi:endonuclease YncB( thermonuclease family)|uniref:thermonuclease family protein n=1 Tax=Roseicyclus sediminis TaxID=2980997 RepID=UPI0021D3BE31|nr:thermonuclease family protein [Roseibacterium sp. SDUM158016]MCU4652901.1 thermonuclease family protein [Roseibacterium sp. SDUM158016]
MVILRFLPVLVLLAVLAFASCQAATPDPSDAASASGGSACRILSVVDGDTVDMSCPGTGTFRARLTGFDTPETVDPGCPAEAQLARQATARLRALVRQANSIEPRFGGTDRYDRRLVRLGLDGRDVGAILVAEGLAVPYSGGRRIDWCTRLG